MPLISLVLMGVLLLGSPFPLAAQDLPPDVSPLGPPGTRLIISDRAVAAGLADVPAHAMSTQRPADTGRDSLENGTIVGAIVGGIATALFVGTVCKVMQEPSDPSCWPGVLGMSALGAGVGAAAGAGIDAMASAQPRPGWRAGANLTQSSR